MVEFLTFHTLAIPPSQVLIHAWLCGTLPLITTDEVNTRCVYYRQEFLPGHHKDNITLVPFFDMINHSTDENVSVSRVENALEIRSTRSISENEEITFSYHSASSRFWICEYGFWLEKNEYDDLDISQEIQSVVASQMEWLEREGYWGYVPRNIS